MSQTSKKDHHHKTVYLVVLGAFLFLCPTRTAAVPIAKYHQSLKAAIEELESLFELQHEGDGDFSIRLDEASESIRRALPERQQVEIGAEVYNVDNSWLHTDLNELEKLPVEDRNEGINHILQALQALERRVDERQTPGASGESKDETKRRLESILARPEYTTKVKGPNALARLIQDFLGWLAKILPKPKPLQPGGANWLTWVAQFLVVLVALLVIAYVVRLVLTRLRHPGKRKSSKKQQPRIVLGERLEPEETATDLLSEAEALARRGELRAAIRKAYIALLVELGDRKLISLAQHKTNRDYLNSVRNLPQLHSRMRGLTESFERHWYGFADATQNDWQDFREGYLAALHAGN